MSHQVLMCPTKPPHVPQCLKCLGNTAGWNCQECKEHHFGNPLRSVLCVVCSVLCVVCCVLCVVCRVSCVVCSVSCVVCRVSCVMQLTHDMCRSRIYSQVSRSEIQRLDTVPSPGTWPGHRQGLVRCRDGGSGIKTLLSSPK